MQGIYAGDYTWGCRRGYYDRYLDDYKKNYLDLSVILASALVLTLVRKQTEYSFSPRRLPSVLFPSVLLPSVLHQ